MPLRAAAAVLFMAAAAHAGPPLSNELALGPARGSAGSVSEASYPHVAFVPAPAPFYVVVWGDTLAGQPDHIRGARIAVTGSVLSQLAVEVDAGFRDIPVVAPLGRGFITAWQEYPGAATVIAVRRFDADGTPLEPRVVIGRAGGEDYSPALAAVTDLSQAALVYQSDRNMGFEVYAERFEPGGARLDDGGLRITTSAANELYPSVCARNDVFVTTFRRDPVASADALYARVDGAGLVLDPGGLPLDPRTGFQNAPRCTCSAATCLLCWEDASNGRADDIFCSPLEGAGPPPVARNLTDQPGSQVSLTAAWLADHFTVVWVDERPDAGPGLWGREVSSDGGLGPIQSYVPQGDHPQLAGDGLGGALLVYERVEGSPPAKRIFARLLGRRAEGATCNEDLECRGRCDATRLCTSAPLEDGGTTQPDGGPTSPARTLDVTCGCGAGPGLALLPLLALLVRSARRRSAQRPTARATR